MVFRVFARMLLCGCSSSPGNCKDVLGCYVVSRVFWVLGKMLLCGC